MPFYSYQCRECGETATFADSMRTTRAPFYQCDNCGGMAFRVYDTPQVAIFTPYVTDSFDGTVREVRTAAQENELCRVNNCSRLLSTDRFDPAKSRKRREENARKAMRDIREDYEETRHKLGVGKETTLADLPV